MNPSGQPRQQGPIHFRPRPKMSNPYDDDMYNVGHSQFKFQIDKDLNFEGDDLDFSNTLGRHLNLKPFS